MSRHYDWLSIEPSRQGEGVVVYGWDTWPSTSVLAGQHRKSYIDAWQTEAAARYEYPGAEDGCFHRDAGNTVAHLPGEDDPDPHGDTYMESVTQHENSGDWYE